MVSLSDFARKMGVCANTVRRWMKEGVITEGVHYLRVGHVIRFPWGYENIQQLMKSLAPDLPPPRPKLQSRMGNRGRLKLRA